MENVLTTFIYVLDFLIHYIRELFLASWAFGCVMQQVFTQTGKLLHTALRSRASRVIFREVVGNMIEGIVLQLLSQMWQVSVTDIKYSLKILFVGGWWLTWGILKESESHMVWKSLSEENIFFLWTVLFCIRLKQSINIRENVLFHP